jgi:hypothetical protein
VSRRRFTPREAVNVAARAIARCRGWDCPDDLDVVLAAEGGDQRAREMALLGEAAALALLAGEAGGEPWVASLAPAAAPPRDPVEDVARVALAAAGYRAGVRAAALAAYLIPEPAEGEEDEEVLRRLRVKCAVLGRDCLNLAAALEEAPTDEELAAVRAADPAVAWWFGQLRPEAVKDALALFLSVRRRGVAP